MPGAGDVLLNRSQFDARLSGGTMWPKTRIAAPQPQNACGQPAGRPPTRPKECDAAFAGLGDKAVNAATATMIAFIKNMDPLP